MINKSFQLIRTNPALTTNVKLVVDSNYRLYLESFDTNTQLSDQKYKHHRINSDTLYEREIVKFYDGLSNQLAFDIKYDSDNTSVFKTYDKQFDDMYWSGAKYVDDNWYEEDGEYFAPLYIRKGDIPEGFIILRVDEATPYEETDNEFSLAKLTKDNFDSQIVDKWKCVSFYDMRYQSKLGSFLSNNFIENTRFPSRAFELNFRKYEFSKWYGIDYIAGAYVNKSKFLQNTLFYEQPHFRLEKEIIDVYKSENIIFPNILNLKFLFKDIPATPSSTRNYSLNRYYGFYADKLEFVTNLTSYLTSEIRPNLTLRNNIFIENDVESIESPFVEGFDPTKTYWLNIGEDFYEVVKIMEDNKYVYKIISDIDFSGFTLTNFNDRSCIINYIEGYNYRCRTISNPSGYTNFVSGFTANFKIDTYLKDNVETPMYGDLYLILIDDQYHILKYREGNYYIQSDYAINSFPSGLEYWKGGKYSKYYVSKPIYKYKEKPLMYPVYRVKFSDVKDFDFDRVNTHFSDFEYEKDTYHVTPEHKLYAVDYTKSTTFNKAFMMHPRGVDGQYQIMNTSSEYIADDELYEISFNDLTSIWRKSQSVVKWGFVGSNAQCDYPYKLNNSLDIGDIHNRTCDIKTSIPTDTAKNLDYFYRIGNLYTTETYEDIFLNSADGSYVLLPENGCYKFIMGVGVWRAEFPDGNYYIDVQRQNPPLPTYSPYYDADPVYSRTGNIISTTPLRYLNQSTNIEVDFMEDYSKKFNLDLYLNSDVDYFEYFFKNKAYYTIDDINYVKPTVKYSVFQNGDSYSPSTTIFKGLNINILPITNITRERSTGKILNYITDNNKNFNDYKFSIILNDVYEYYDGNVYSGITENGLTENTVIDKNSNGIHVFLNEKFKNVLVIINIKIVMQSKFLTLNNVDRFGENYGLYTGKRLDGGSFITPLDSVSVSPNNTFIKETYNPALISAANFIDAFDDMNSISEFDSGITFYYLNSAGQFGSTGPINIYSKNSMINVPGWNQLYPPFILTINDPEPLETKKISYTKNSIKGPVTNIYDKYKTFYDSESKQKSNIVEPLARKMELNVIQDNLVNSQIFRYNGVYEPIFKDIPLFNNIFLYKSGTITKYISSNSKFDTSFKNFGAIEELIFSKVNPIESPLKLKDTDKDISIYPMVDEFGYQYLNRFIFNSNWDKDFYVMTNKDTDTLTPQVIPPAPIPIDTEPPTTPCAAINLFGGNIVSLIWSPSTDNVGVTEYLIYRSIGDSDPNSPNFLTPYASVNPNSILEGTTELYWSETINLTLSYYYYVVASDAAGNLSDHCGIVSIIPPAATCPKWPSTPALQLTLTPVITSPIIRTIYVSTTTVPYPSNTVLIVSPHGPGYYQVGDIITNCATITDGAIITSVGSSSFDIDDVSKITGSATGIPATSTRGVPTLTGLHLEWVNAVQGTYSIAGYEIWSSIDSTTNFNLLTTTTNTIFDPIINLNTAAVYRYYVKAYDTQIATQIVNSTIIDTNNLTIGQAYTIISGSISTKNYEDVSLQDYYVGDVFVYTVDNNFYWIVTPPSAVVSENITYKPCYTPDSNTVSYNLSALPTGPIAPVLTLNTDFVTSTNLTWLASIPGTFPVAGYEIYRSTDGINYNLIATTTSLSYSNSVGNPGATYYYYVKAFDNQSPSSLYSANSNIVTYQAAVITFNFNGKNNPSAYIDLTKLGNLSVDITIQLFAQSSAYDNVGGNQGSTYCSIVLYKNGTSIGQATSSMSIDENCSLPSANCSSTYSYSVSNIINSSQIDVISDLSGNWSQGYVDLYDATSAKILSCTVTGSPTKQVPITLSQCNIYHDANGDSITEVSV